MNRLEFDKIKPSLLSEYYISNSRMQFCIYSEKSSVYVELFVVSQSLKNNVPYLSSYVEKAIRNLKLRGDLRTIPVFTNMLHSSKNSIV